MMGGGRGGVWNASFLFVPDSEIERVVGANVGALAVVVS